MVSIAVCCRIPRSNRQRGSDRVPRYCRCVGWPDSSIGLSHHCESMDNHVVRLFADCLQRGNASDNHGAGKYHKCLCSLLHHSCWVSAGNRGGGWVVGSQFVCDSWRSLLSAYVLFQCLRWSNTCPSGDNIRCNRCRPADRNAAVYRDHVRSCSYVCNRSDDQALCHHSIRKFADHRLAG
jgi:hypothetical protein